jgi:transposase-like protein
MSFFTDDLEFLLGILCFGSALLAIAVQLGMNACPNCNRSQFKVVKIKGKVIRTESWALNPMYCPWCNEKLNDPYNWRKG